MVAKAAPSAQWTKAASRVSEAQRRERARERAESAAAAAAALEENKKKDAALKAAKREAVRLAAAEVGSKALAQQQAAADEEAARKADTTSKQSLAAARLWIKVKKASETAGLKIVKKGGAVVPLAQPGSSHREVIEGVSAAASRLRDIVIEALAERPMIDTADGKALVTNKIN